MRAIVKNGVCAEVASSPVVVTVNPTLTPSVSMALTSGTNPMCAVASATFTATPTNGGTPSYQWQVAGVNVGTNSSTFTTTGLTNEQVVTCVMTSNAICVSPTTATSAGITMIVNSLPIVTLQILCNGTTDKKVEILASNGLEPYSTFDQELPVISQTSNIFSIPFDSTRNFRVIDNNGCSSTWVSYTAQAQPTISTSTSTGTCMTKGLNNWWTITDISNKFIVSILDSTSNLGEITATSYVEATTNVYHQTYYLKRHFKITSQNKPTSPVTLRLYFTDEELNELITNSKLNVNVEDNVNDISNLKVTRYSGVNEDNIYSNNDTTCGACFTVYTPSTGATMGANYVQITVSGFSEEWIHGGTNNTSILPIQLVSFKTKCLDNGVLIRWVTTSEYNNSHFNLQRSVDGINFTNIGRIEGSVNSNSIIEYSYIDNFKSTIQVYYRLVQVDFNGTTIEHNPEALKCETILDNIIAFPNPVKVGEYIEINGIKDNIFEIFTIDGKTIDYELIGNKIKFNEPNIYFLHTPYNNIKIIVY